MELVKSGSVSFAPVFSSPPRYALLPPLLSCAIGPTSQHINKIMARSWGLIYDLHHLQFSIKAASPETFGYTLLYPCILIRFFGNELISQ